MAYTKNRECMGEDCISCCEVKTECDCGLISCVTDFTTYAMNYSREFWSGFTSTEIACASAELLGMTVLGTYERPVKKDPADATNTISPATYGRTLVQSWIENWGVDSAALQTKFQELHRVLHPFADKFLKDKCACNDDNTQRVECKSLANILYTIESFAYIGQAGYASNLKEWAEGGLCGVCYQDCNGKDFVFDK